jgi:hypothetical protein
MHGSLPSDAEQHHSGRGQLGHRKFADPLAAARTAAYLILTSAQYQVER